MRRLWGVVFRRALSTFFRRIEIQGLERIPAHEPVVFVSNHPSALVDPLMLLCFAPRPVSFLAKAPLFRMPLIGFFTRAFQSIPVYRRQDAGTDLARNHETFEAARRLLTSGGTLALFPEGASHGQPSLLPMKTGAARIALGAAARIGGPLSVVPASLYYTWKERFRSGALLTFGEPIGVPAVELDPDGEPAAPAVRDLTDRIARALADLTLQAQTHQALELVRRADRIVSGERSSKEGALSSELLRRQRFVEGYRILSREQPARVAALEERIVRFESERRSAGLSLEHLTPEGLGVGGAARLLVRNLGALILTPMAVVGVLIHYPAYRLVGWLARRIARREDDVLATAKVGVSMLAFPATWIIAAAVIGRLSGLWPGLAALVLAPATGWAALRAGEALNQILGRARALQHLLFARESVERLVAERHTIRKDVEALAEELELTGARPANTQ